MTIAAFIAIGVLVRIDEAPLWRFLAAGTGLLLSGRLGWYAVPSLILSLGLWSLAAAAIGWLLHGILVAIYFHWHEKSKPSA